MVTGLHTRTCTSFIVVTGTHTVYSSGTSSETVYRKQSRCRYESVPQERTLGILDLASLFLSFHASPVHGASPLLSLACGL